MLTDRKTDQQEWVVPTITNHFVKGIFHKLPLSVEVNFLMHNK